ncbi:MAG: molybdenum cofactor guanylyltransferase [Fuerstiella sp.]|nr:molybdenum cofactor guanylyltransferase [Fuerstiella sp.]
MSATKTTNSPAAIVLCGGKSLRMGTDKALVRLGGETLLQRCCRLISKSADPVVVVSSPSQVLPELAQRILVTEDHLPGEGPLTGLLAGLRQIRRRVPFGDFPIWVGSCDAPFVNVGVINAMVWKLGEFDAVAVRHRGRINPHSAVYRLSVIETVERVVMSGERRATAILDHLSLKTVESTVLHEIDPDLAFLCNLNTAEDLERARARLGKESSGP